MCHLFFLCVCGYVHACVHVCVWGCVCVTVSECVCAKMSIFLCLFKRSYEMCAINNLLLKITINSTDLMHSVGWLVQSVLHR